MGAARRVARVAPARALGASKSQPQLTRTLTHRLTPPPSPHPLQVLLQERSVKELECTNNCTQVFVVVAGQPGGVQVDIGDHSYLVSPGDHFHVPQQCDYRLTNHSSDTPAQIAFMVIKPPQRRTRRRPQPPPHDAHARAAPRLYTPAQPVLCA